MSSASLLTNAQELRRVTKINDLFGEIYYVLKNDRKIKQGQYLKYFESLSINDKAILSYGSYDNNKRSGAWFFCDFMDISNPIISIGEYANDKKVGKWVYFYKPLLTGKIKHTKLILPTKGNEKLNIILDTTGIAIAAVGDYTDDKKTGIWTYYFKKGAVACKYDFSANSMIYNNSLVTYDQLGGIERFESLFYQTIFEKALNDGTIFSQNSNVILEIDTYQGGIEIKIINPYGNISFAKAMGNIIARMDLDWINFDPRLEENKILVQIGYYENRAISLESVKPLK